MLLTREVQLSVIPEARRVVAEHTAEGAPPGQNIRRSKRRLTLALSVLIGGTIGCYALIGFTLHALFAG